MQDWHSLVMTMPQVSWCFCHTVRRIQAKHPEAKSVFIFYDVTPRVCYVNAAASIMSISDGMQSTG